MNILDSSEFGQIQSYLPFQISEEAQNFLSQTRGEPLALSQLTNHQYPLQISTGSSASTPTSNAGIAQAQTFLQNMNQMPISLVTPISLLNSQFNSNAQILASNQLDRENKSSQSQGKSGQKQKMNNSNSRYEGGFNTTLGPGTNVAQSSLIDKENIQEYYQNSYQNTEEKTPNSNSIHANASSLVQQLKSGALTKEQLLSRLQSGLSTQSQSNPQSASTLPLNFQDDLTKQLNLQTFSNLPQQNTLLGSTNINNTASNNLLLSEVPQMTLTSQMNSLFGSYIDSSNSAAGVINEIQRENAASLLLPETEALSNNQEHVLSQRQLIHHQPLNSIGQISQQAPQRNQTSNQNQQLNMGLPPLQKPAPPQIISQTPTNFKSTINSQIPSLLVQELGGQSARATRNVESGQGSLHSQQLAPGSLLDQVSGTSAHIQINQQQYSTANSASNKQSVTTANFMNGQEFQSMHMGLQTVRLSAIQVAEDSLAVNNLINVTNFNGCDDLSQDIIQMQRCSLSQRSSQERNRQSHPTLDDQAALQLQFQPKPYHRGPGFQKNLNTSLENDGEISLLPLNFKDHKIGTADSKERKAFQLPLQFTDRFFEEDPGLIKIIDTDRQMKDEQHIKRAEQNLKSQRNRSPSPNSNQLNNVQANQQSQQDLQLLTYNSCFYKPSSSSASQLETYPTYLQQQLQQHQLQSQSSQGQLQNLHTTAQNPLLGGTQITLPYDDEGLVEFYDRSNMSRQSFELLKNNSNQMLLKIGAERRHSSQSRHEGIPNLNSVASAESLPVVNAQLASSKVLGVTPGIPTTVQNLPKYFFDQDEQSQQENEFDQEEILRKASELTKAIDNQFSYLLSQREDSNDQRVSSQPLNDIALMNEQQLPPLNAPRGVHQDNYEEERTQRFASIFNSPQPQNNSNLKHYLQSSHFEVNGAGSQVMVTAPSEQLVFSNFSSNTGSKPNLLISQRIEDAASYNLQTGNHTQSLLQTQRLPDLRQYNDLTQSHINDTYSQFYEGQSCDGGLGISTILANNKPQVNNSLMNGTLNQQRNFNAAQSMVNNQPNTGGILPSNGKGLFGAASMVHQRQPSNSFANQAQTMRTPIHANQVPFNSNGGVQPSDFSSVSQNPYYQTGHKSQHQRVTKHSSKKSNQWNITPNNQMNSFNPHNQQNHPLQTIHSTFYDGTSQQTITSYDQSTQPSFPIVSAVNQNHFQQFDYPNHPHQDPMDISYNPGGIMGYEIINDTKNFRDRNSKWVNQQQYKRNLIKEQADQTELKECTFKPQTNSKSSKMLRDRRNGSASTRNEMLYEQKFKKVEQTQQRYNKEETERLQQACTFRPQVNEKDKYGGVVTSRYMQITEDLVTNRIHVNDFYNAGLQHYNMEESKLKECTFVPQINGLKKGMQTAQLYTSINAFERLSKPLSQLMPQIEGNIQSQQIQSEANTDENGLPITESNDQNDLMNPYLNNTIPEEESEIDKIQSQLNSFGQQLQNFQTFNQQLSPEQQQQLLLSQFNSFNQNQVQNPLGNQQFTFSNGQILSPQQQQPMTGCFQTNSEFSPAHQEQHQQLLQQLEQLQLLNGEGINQAYPETSQHNQTKSQGMPQHLVSLLERQNQFMERKEEKIKRILEETAPSHRPNINDLACTLYLEHSKGVGFHDRQQALLDKKSNLQMLQQQSIMQVCSFQPQITKLAAQMPSKTIEEKCYGDLLKKQQKIDQIQNQIAAEKRNIETFKPQIAGSKLQEFDQVQSKLKLHQGGLDAFITNMTSVQQQRVLQAEQLKIDKELQELKECTHKPQTVQCPEYIKRIAEESKKLKAEKAKLESSLPPQKPEFRVC